MAVPLDVRLDDSNVFAPDLLWCAEGRVPARDDQPPYAMPDIAVEVRSPATWRYDIGAKKSGYEQHGLPELWLVDTAAEVVLPRPCIAQRYALCMTAQLVARVPDALVAAVDDLVRAGVYASRSDAVRDGLTAVIDHQRRGAIGKAIADGYRRSPQPRDELSWPDSASAAMIAEEPW